MEPTLVPVAGSNPTNVLSNQYSTFFVSGRAYGVAVNRVQEVVRALPMTRVHRAPVFVRGLLNLRGQVVTAIDLRSLFGLDPSGSEQPLNVICTAGGNLVSLLVDEVGDVIEVSQDQYEPLPAMVASEVRRFASGVFKTPTMLLTIVDVDRIVKMIGDGEQG